MFWCVQLMALPASVVRSSLSLALGVLDVGVSLVGFVATRTLPPRMLRRLQGDQKDWIVTHIWKSRMV